MKLPPEVATFLMHSNAQMLKVLNDELSGFKLEQLEQYA